MELTNLPDTLNQYPVVAYAPHREDSVRVLVYRDDVKLCPWVVATWSKNCGTGWTWGHYYDTLHEAVDHYRDGKGDPLHWYARRADGGKP